MPGTRKLSLTYWPTRWSETFRRNMTSELCHTVAYWPSWPSTSQSQSHRNQNPSSRNLRAEACAGTLSSHPEFIKAPSANSCLHRDQNPRGRDLQTAACTRRSDSSLLRRHHYIIFVVQDLPVHAAHVFCGRRETAKVSPATLHQRPCSSLNLLHPRGNCWRSVKSDACVAKVEACVSLSMEPLFTSLRAALKLHFRSSSCDVLLHVCFSCRLEGLVAVHCSLRAGSS